MMATMTAVIELEEKVCWKARAGSGHSVMIDGPVEAGGENAGFRPMELMLVGLGGCMAYDVLVILRRMRQDVNGYKLRIKGQRAEQPPSVYTAVTLEHVISGSQISESAVKHALELAEHKYCSASAMFSQTARIDNIFQIQETD
jgi:putative redox protein